MTVGVLAMPSAVAALPRDKHTRPVPWFVHVDDVGVPDFRVVRRGGIEDALRFEWCWVCGKPRGKHASFVIGPMCAINRVSAEPPSHLDCAVYSARACPFLSTPSMSRRERGLPAERMDPAGVPVWRNPGAALVWSSRTWRPFSAPGGILFYIGDSTSVSWWAQGREATRDEVLASIESGLPILRGEAEREGTDAVAELERLHERALLLLPA